MRLSEHVLGLFFASENGATLTVGFDELIGLSIGDAGDDDGENDEEAGSGPSDEEGEQASTNEDGDVDIATPLGESAAEAPELSAEAEPRTLLVHFLRDTLGLTGTNIGCDSSSCGACTVHVDGQSAKSCTMLAVQADGARITTIEGLAGADGTLHPMQQAFHECHALQCGYCTPGMVMAAVSLLDEKPNPTEQEVRHGLEGNLCRCTGYHNIVKAVLTAAGGA